MATIDEFPIPPDMIAEMKRMLAEAPDDAILSYVEATPSLAKGFRPGSKKSVAPIRKRMMRMLDSDRELDVLFLGIIASADRVGALISRISDLAILETLGALFTLHGRNPVLAALLADYREEVREIAVGVLDEDIPAKTVDLQEARDAIRGCFEPVVACVKDIADREKDRAETTTGDPPLTPSASRNTEIDTLRNRVTELERDLKKQAGQSKNEKTIRKKLDTLNQQKQRLEKELREAAKRITQEESKENDLKAQLKKANEKATALEESIVDRVTQSVQAELGTLRNRWLSKPLAVDRAAEVIRATDQTDDLLTGVESILKRQEDIDRHSGNLRTLRERIQKLTAALQKVRTAMAEALHPLPELARVQSSIEQEISRLDTLVGESPTAQSDFVTRMRTRINAAESEEELVELQAFLDKLNEIGAFSPPELQELYRCCHNRMSIVYASFTPNVIRAKRHPNDPVWRLINDVEENRAFVIILDGHNVVHLLPNLFGNSYENGIPGAAARAMLVRMVVDALKGARKCEAHIFFDAPTPDRRQHAENVWEIYSGGGHGEHRADKVITDYMEYCCQTMSAMRRLLVTDDRDLRARAVELGAKFMPVPQFGAFLEEMRK